MVIWLLVTRPGVPNSRFQYSIIAVGVIINLDSDLDGLTEDAKGDIAKVIIILD